mmetsp:Transcript_21970/g.61101  ORF Transcript_21970/g.61101 Transcript_21970/m.61101 type:complete len:211 (-) Transcript_21970:2507-3139(-)
MGPIFSASNVLGKASAEGPPNGKFLGHDEGFQHHLDGRIHVVVTNIVSQMHLGVGFGHSHDAFHVPDGDGNSPGILRFPAKGNVQGGNLFLVKGIPLQGWLDVGPGVLNVLAQELLVDDALFVVGNAGARRECCLSIVEFSRSYCIHVTRRHEICQLLVEDRVYGVLEDAQNVKSLQNRSGELHIVGKRIGTVVSATDGVGGGNHRTPRL